MAKTYRSYDPDQQLLLPPSLNDWVPEDHLSRFVGDLVNSLDLGEIISSYEVEERGNPPFHPVMMTKVLLYGYAVGIYSGRRLSKALVTDVAFRFLAAQATPDFRTLSKFRHRHRDALAALFEQVLGACRKAGLVKLGAVAIDGTKVKASASKHKAMSHKRMLERKDEYTRVIKEWFKRSDAEDQADDRKYGKDRHGDELPAHLATKQKRLEKITEALAALKKEAKAAAVAAGEDPAKAVVPDKAQRNFTDPESRILKTGDGFIQGYNAQAAVDAESQVIVAQDVFQEGSDSLHLSTMVRSIKKSAGRYPKMILADSGYCSESNLKKLPRQIDPYIAVGRIKHGEAPAAPRGRIPTRLTLRQRMARKLLTIQGKRIYAKRKVSVEPAFGQIKQGRGFRQFLTRGLYNARKEWSLICTAHNINKLYRSSLKLRG